MIEHDVVGQTARFERYVADKVYAVASGMKLDPDRNMRFGEIVDELYKNPFKAKEEKMSAKDIIDYYMERLSEVC